VSEHALAYELIDGELHRHGESLTHAHRHAGPHDHGAHQAHSHSHSLIDPSIRRSRAGLRAVGISLVVLGATAAIQAAYGKLVEASFTQTGTAPRQVNIQASEGYLAGSANYDFTTPDFSAVAGWDNNWGPKVGAQTTWMVTAYSFTGIGFGSPNPVEGSTYTGASRNGTITP